MGILSIQMYIFIGGLLPEHRIQDFDSLERKFCTANQIGPKVPA